MTFKQSSNHPVKLNIQYMINDEVCTREEYDKFFAEQQGLYGNVVTRVGILRGRFFSSIIDNKLAYRKVKDED